MKTFSKVTLLLALTLALSLFACDDKPKDDTKRQTITFGPPNNLLSTTVTGHMTNSQWENVIVKLTTALNAAAKDGSYLGPSTVALFGMGVNIDLVKNSVYQYYNADFAGKKISLNADYVIGASQADLSDKVVAAINGMLDNGPAQQ